MTDWKVETKMIVSKTGGENKPNKGTAKVASQLG